MLRPNGAPVRSLHVCHTTDRRGAEVSTVDLAAELRERGLRSRAVALQPGAATEQLDLETLGNRGRTPFALLRLRRCLRDYDLVVAHGASSLLAVATATRGVPMPFVYRMIGDPRFWADVRFRGVRISRPLRAADRVVTLWSGAAQAVAELHDVDPGRIEVIVNGRDPDLFWPPTTEERTEARRALGLPIDAPVVGYLGALSWEKDPLLAIDAIRLVPGAHLAMAGGGPLRMEVEEAAATAAGSVHVLGPLEDPRRFLWAIDVLLLTSRTEGLPGVVIEGGLCGRPAVAPDVGGTSDLVDDTTGCLLPRGSDAEAYAAALAEVLADATARGTVLRQRCLTGFTVASAADRWLALFGELQREVEGRAGS